MLATPTRPATPDEASAPIETAYIRAPRIPAFPNLSLSSEFVRLSRLGWPGFPVPAAAELAQLLADHVYGELNERETEAIVEAAQDLIRRRGFDPLPAVEYAAELFVEERKGDAEIEAYCDSIGRFW